MRLLFISSIKYWGGGEAWMLSAARGLAARGHAVTLACQPGSRLEVRARAAGLPPTPLRMRADLDPRVTWKCWRLIRERRIDVVCANMDKEIRLAGPAAALAGVPLIRRRGSDIPFPNALRHRLVNQWFVRRVIVNSHATRETLLRGNPWLAPEKLELIYNGIALEPPVAVDRDAVLREFDLTDCSPLLVVVGMLKARKGHAVLLRALADVRAQIPHAGLLIAGDGPLEAPLRDLASDLGITGQVRFAGFRDDVRRLVGAADMLVLPSENEGFGYVLAEAMAQARPVIASRISSIPEVVGEDEAGLLVPPGDPAALGRAIAELARDPERAREMGAAGRRRVETRFTLEGMLDDLEAFFARTIGDAGAATEG
jgi:glycosyltransferase involved in cell wall biosynthesis